LLNIIQHLNVWVLGDGDSAFTMGETGDDGEGELEAGDGLILLVGDGVLVSDGAAVNDFEVDGDLD